MLIAQCRQHLVFHLDAANGLLRKLFILSSDSSDSLAHPAHLIGKHVVVLMQHRRNGNNALVVAFLGDVIEFEIIKSQKPPVDAILMDTHIQGENSVRLYNTLRTLKPDMKIIIYTDDIHGEDIRKFEEEEVDGILAKPFNAEDFYILLQEPVRSD